MKMYEDHRTGLRKAAASVVLLTGGRHARLRDVAPFRLECSVKLRHARPSERSAPPTPSEWQHQAQGPPGSEATAKQFCAKADRALLRQAPPF